MSQEGNASGGFDLVDNPIPIAYSFQSNWHLSRILRERIPDSTRFVMNPSLFQELPIAIKYGKLRKPAMSITTDLMMGHAAPPSLHVVGVQQV